MIALVAEDRKRFIALERDAPRWVAPELLLWSLGWQWIEWDGIGPGRTYVDLWAPGRGMADTDDRFLVDEKTRYLWVIRPNTPTGAHVGPEGEMWAPPSDELRALDLDESGPVWLTEMDESGESVYGHALRSVSASPDMVKLTLGYVDDMRRDVYGDCVGSTFDEDLGNYTDELIFLQDGSVVTSAGISHAPNGKSVVLVRRTYGGQFLTRMADPSGAEVGALPIPLVPAGP